MSITAVDKTNVDYAFNRLMRFVSINNRRPEEEKAEALYTYCASVGLEEDTIDYLYELCDTCFRNKDDTSSCAFIGVLLGLAVAEDIFDNPKQ